MGPSAGDDPGSDSTRRKTVRITQRIVGDVVILDLEGRILFGCNEVPGAVAALAATGRLKVLLNLEAVSYWERIGFGEVATPLIALKQRGGTLKLLKPRKQLRRVLEETRLTPAFEIYEEEEAALRSFADSPAAVPEEPGR